MSLFPKKASLTAYCLVLSLFTLVAFHGPFFRQLLQRVEGGFNGVVLAVSAAVLLFVLDFLLYYLLVYLLRLIGKCIVAFTLFGDAVMLYFVREYEVLVTDEMMGNVIHTQTNEAVGFFSFTFVLYVLGFCVLPCLYVFARKVDYGSWKRLPGCVGVSLAALLAVVFGNMKNWPWIDRNAPVLGSLLMPWSYTVNTFRFLSAERSRNEQEILLPDVTAVSGSRDVCVLFIGESVRRDRFSLYGYSRETNPYTSRDSVTALVANASATYTTAGVKAILEPFESGQLYEILPNYLQRAGADVTWRTSNWGEPPVHTEKYYRIGDLREKYPEVDGRYDGILLSGLREEIMASDSAKVFVVIHAYTNHGPAYHTDYPAEFEVFTPVSSTVEMAKVSREELDNAYDNSIVYTDYLIHSVIDIVRSVPDRRGCVLFVSDHGESLGENNLYMHGVPMAMAPREQIEIPFVVWTSDPSLRVKDLPEVGQHHVFHSVLDFFHIESPVFDENFSIFDTLEPEGR